MRRKSKWASWEVRPHEAEVVHIGGDAGMATATVADGKLLPMLILDTSSRPDIEEHIRIHEKLGPGDVRIQWAQRPDHQDEVLLVLSFERPSEFKAFIAFDLTRHQGVLVDQILTSGGFYIQAGRMGDRFRNHIDKPRLIVEAPDTGFKSRWEEIYKDYTFRALCRAGLNRTAAKRAAAEAIGMLRKIGSFRMPA
jgi:hypothetical protein